MLYEHVYTLVTSAKESQEITRLELLDEKSSPSAVVNAILRMKTVEFVDHLGAPPSDAKLKITVEVVETPKPKQAQPA